MHGVDINSFVKFASGRPRDNLTKLACQAKNSMPSSCVRPHQAEFPVLKTSVEICSLVIPFVL